MPADNNNNVVKLRQSQPQAAAGVVVDDPISPKSIINMTDVEQDFHLQQLRERRMRAAEIMRRAAADKINATSVAIAVRLEKKQEMVKRLYERAVKALDKLEEGIYALRALHLQHTDTDITKVTDDAKNALPPGDKS